MSSNLHLLPIALVALNVLAPTSLFALTYFLIGPQHLYYLDLRICFEIHFLLPLSSHYTRTNSSVCADGLDQ
jgi:hypothetical protein